MAIHSAAARRWLEGERWRATACGTRATRIAVRCAAAVSASVATSVNPITIIAASVTIVFLTFFMLLEGRRWVAGTLDLVPARSRPRWERVAAGVARTIRGYVAGNLAISVVAGAVAWVTLASLGIPYAVPVAVAVAILDLVPLVGATVGALAAPLVIPPLALNFGWEAAFVVIGALGFVWMGFWVFMYQKPEVHPRVNAAELTYIQQDRDLEQVAPMHEVPVGGTAFGGGVLAHGRDHDAVGQSQRAAR